MPELFHRTRSPHDVREVIERIRAEYVEMPGMRLTSMQVERLCGVDTDVCCDVMSSLVAEGFLARNADGTYVRRTAERVRSTRSGGGSPEPGTHRE